VFDETIIFGSFNRLSRRVSARENRDGGACGDVNGRRRSGGEGEGEGGGGGPGIAQRHKLARRRRARSFTNIEDRRRLSLRSLSSIER